MNIFCNCCDGIYNSIDVHFTSDCDNRCSHCIDSKYNGLGLHRPNVDKIINKIISIPNIDDVLFLGGEPCLYLHDLYNCVKKLKNKTNLKLYVTTAVPKICHDERELFIKMIELLDGINLSVQHYDENIADKIRMTKSLYDRQSFYTNLPFKEKIRINLNIVKPYLYTRDDIDSCIRHYDSMGFNSIKLSEIQHGKEFYVSFEETFNIKMKSAYSNGCQTYLNIEDIFPRTSTPILLKRSCFLCEETLSASIADGVKAVSKLFFRNKNNYSVIYSDGTLNKGWI